MPVIEQEMIKRACNISWLVYCARSLTDRHCLFYLFKSGFLTFPFLTRAATRDTEGLVSRAPSLTDNHCVRAP